MSRCRMETLWKWILTSGMILWLHSHAVALTIESDQQLTFADTLFTNQQYLRAAEEYQRFVFFFPNHHGKRAAVFKAGEAFMLAKEPGRAIEQFQLLTQVQPLDHHAIESFFKMSQCFLSLNSPPHALAQLNHVIALSDDPAIKDRAFYRIGWIHIDMADWTGAQKAFDALSPTGIRRYGLVEVKEVLSNNSAIPSKKPYLAGALSIVPGAGQLYCRRYEDAIYAFIVNLGLIWGAVDAFDNEQFGLGGLLSFIGLGFYTGNIYGAVNDAHKYNDRQTRRFVDQLKQYQVNLAGPSRHGAAGKGLILSLGIPF
jgi:tetratricopeptide (TPR) repeat protein